MIEVKIPGVRHGMGYIAADYHKGSFVQRDGVFSQGDIDALPAGQKNQAGWAQVGSLKLTQVTSAADGQRGTVFPINKLLFFPEDSDSTHDLVKAGAGVIFYQGGEFETDQFLNVSGAAGGDYGDNLEITVSGKLTESGSADSSLQVVAKVVKMTFGDSYNDIVKGQEHDKDLLWYTLL